MTLEPARWVDKNDPSKGKVYEEFYYADFGPAGKWMTTNLTAWMYDGPTHPVTELKLDASDSFSDPHYCYPNGVSSQPDTWNSQQGLLYNWSAATKGKTPLDQEGAKDYYSEQGICPRNWHLPTDYEWTQLENEIIRRTCKYANMANISSDGKSCFPEQPQDNNFTGWRGTTHGRAMKFMKENGGASHILEQNGFAVLLVGHASNATTDYSQSAYFWTDSSNGSTDYAWRRRLLPLEDRVERLPDSRTNLFSVRCKKDEWLQ